MTQTRCPRCQAMGQLDLSCPRCSGTGQVCDRCLGMGYLYTEEGLRACPCGLVRAREMEGQSMSRLSALHGRLTTCTFDTFDTNGPETKYATKAFNAALAWAKEPQGFLTIHSPTKGNGKTHLAAAAANYLIGKGEIVLFCKAVELLVMLRGCYDREDETVNTLMAKLQGVPILIVDDLGVEKRTAWTDEQMYLLVDHRLERDKPTLFTSNCPISELEDRIRSRISHRGSRLVHNKAQEYTG
jgi:DNA replication protein DnaC